MSFAATSHNPKRWARQHLSVRVAILMWITTALVGPVYLALPGVDHRHATAVYLCSAAAVAWALMNLIIPNDPRLRFLFPAGGCLALADIGVLVASTGGAVSPLRASILLVVVFAAWFRPGPNSLRMLIGAMLATLAPLAYDPRALAGAPLASTIMLLMILAVVGGSIIAARRELERVRDQARAEARRDPLTGLANRRGLDAHFRRLAHHRRVGVALIDLDGFKQVNTRHGHAGGDRALLAVAGALREAVRDHDLVARIGGDEFAIVAADVGVEALAAIAQRAVQDISAASQRLQLDGIALGASAGGAIYPKDGSTPEELLTVADTALSAAKRDGKGRLRLAA